ncbi:phosphoribosylaminoimidazolesuccinocarboxamide synthase [Weissella minor]|uniref:phosphoribosylaminoimidazolesuccinocarboxamide synthase n=1 Tax=Weissella minor TaxID=1620 RepID=UPI001BAF7463|nr:phosphoribosylaminoimidazolesuccinocarboxamide synthase [Weissella minor]MBS0950147.1 phosphoribosylaminoimidazolesuccinocarboxamide synthase [Weissella minor]
MAIEQGEVITTGKAKRLYATNDPELLWVQHLNQATALNGKRKAEIPEKAAYTNQISQLLFEFLNQAGIETHFVQRLSKTESLVQRLEMLPLEVVIRNYASGHFVSRFGIENMQVLEPNVLEFYFKSDALDDPFMNESQILALRLADTETLVQIQTVAHQINQHLKGLFDEIDITLVDFKLEFGRTDAGQVILGDELSPDNMRLVDQSTGASLDKDIFRQNSGDLTIGYAQVLQRLQAKLGA